MRLGLIARAENTGLSVQTHEFYRHMHPARTLLVDMSAGRDRPFRPELYPDAEVVHGIPPAHVLRRFLDGLDVVFTAETAYNPAFYGLAAELGVRTVLQPNYEFLDRAATPNLWAIPSEWHFDAFPNPKTFLPVPIATDRFSDRPRPDKATRFLHIVGRGAMHDRNGTDDLFAALELVQSEIELDICCQNSDYGFELLVRPCTPAHVHVSITAADVSDYWDNYRGHDVLVMPRRFGGLCLPAQEALAAGMPVIMPNISPNGWLPAEWLIPATQTGRFNTRVPVDLYSTDPHALAAKIDQFATDAAFYAAGVDRAGQLAKERSWDALKSEYERILKGSEWHS